MSIKTDPTDNFHNLRNRRQQLAGSVRQLIDDWDRRRILHNHAPEKNHELQLLREALAILGAPGLPSRRERINARQVDALQRELELT